MRIATKIGVIETKEFFDGSNKGVWAMVNGIEIALVEFDSDKQANVVRVWDYKDADEEGYEYIQVTNNKDAGSIGVVEALDTVYPGVWIELDGEGFVLVEYDDSRDKHVIRVWNSENPNDDYEYIQVIE